MAVKKQLETTNQTGTQSGTQANNSSPAGSSLRGVSANTGAELAKYQSGYEQSANVTQAKQNLNNIQNSKPTAFSSTFEQELDSLYDQIKNRGEFTYDINGDALYQQYAQNYKKAGQQAMKDTIGQASAMTGGYGNSYAETAGYQAYQNYMDQLNDKALDFYQLAQDRYNAEGERLNNLYSLAGDRYDTEYGQYRDSVSDYYQDYANAYNQYADERSLDYEQYMDALNYWQSQASAENSDYWAQTNYDEDVRQYDENMAYQKERDSVSDSQWAQEMAYQKERDSISDSQWAQEMAYQGQRDEIADSQWEAELKASAENATSEENYKNILEKAKALYKSKGENADAALAVMKLMNSVAEFGIISEEKIANILDEVIPTEIVVKK